MNKITISLISVAAVAGLFFGGVLFGNLLRDGNEPAGTESESSSIAMATPVPIDPSLPPGTFPDLDPDQPAPPVTWPQATTRVESSIPLAGAHGLTEADLAVLYDAESGIDAVASRDPWIPPDAPATVDDIVADPTTGGPATDDSASPDSTSSTEGTEPEAGSEEGGVEGDEPFLFVLPLSDLWLRFIDPCAGDAPGSGGGDECGDGVGGTIVLTGGGDGEEPDALDVFAQVYSVGSGFEIRCDALRFGADGSYGAVFSTNNPGEFTVNYRASRRPESARSIEVSTTEAELDRWVARRTSGEPIFSDVRNGVHHCITLTGLFPGEHATLEISGVDDFGSEDSVTIYHTLPDSSMTGSTAGRPPSTFEMRTADAGYGRVTVPYDRTAEQVYVASLPRAGVRATTETCGDIENDVLTQRRRMDFSLYNWDTISAPAGFGGEFDPRIKAAVLVDFLGEEGTWHDICVWVTKPPNRTFDKPPVLMRNLHQVRPPRRWRGQLALVGGWSNVPLSVGDIRFSTNWPVGGATSWPQRDLGASTYVFREPFVIRDGGSAAIPASTVLTITAPGGTSTEVAIPSFTGCIPIFSCSARTFYYDIAVPGARPGSAPIANLRVAFEIYAGPGGPMDGTSADGWQISRDDTFMGGGPLKRPDAPQVDSNASSYTVVGGEAGVEGGRPSLVAQLTFDRPVTVTAEPYVVAGDCPLPVEPQSTIEPATTIRLRFDNLCWGRMYTLAVEAIDTDGNVLRDISLATLPAGTRPWMVVDTPSLSVTEYQARVTISGTTHGVREASLHGWTIVEWRHRECATTPIDESTTIRNADGRPLRWNEPFQFNLEFHLATGDCGHSLSSSRRLMLTATPTLEELLAGPYTAVFTEPGGTEVTIEISNVVFATP